MLAARLRLWALAALLPTLMGVYSPAPRPFYHLVFFSDKGPAADSLLHHPAAFLSQRALERRARQGVVVTTADLPVADAYAIALRPHVVRQLGASRWFNAVLVQFAAPADSALVAGMPFVREIRPLDSRRLRSLSTADEKSIELAAGASSTQLRQIQLQGLQEQGYSGQGVAIAVLDAGFLGADINPGLSHVFATGRLLGTWDTYENNSGVFDESTHGAECFSVLAGDVPDTYRGAAPLASYFLLRTEVESFERHLEEYNWLRAIEWADSAGAQIVSSSLSYSDFSAGEGDYTYADMNGRTTIIAQAAQEAVRRGLLVVNSAGNDGNQPWRYISSPCDVDSVLCVGAVTAQMEYASFSSIGPSADGRVKPDVAALGAGAAVLRGSGNVSYRNGTSFSAPLLAGMAACLWQKHPTRSAWEILDAIRRSANQYQQPDAFLGYGIPDALRADALLSGRALPENTTGLHLSPNPARDVVVLTWMQPSPGTFRASMLDILGREVCSLGRFATGVRYEIKLPPLSPGAYVVWVQPEGSGKPETARLLVQQ